MPLGLSMEPGVGTGARVCVTVGAVLLSAVAYAQAPPPGAGPPNPDPGVVEERGDVIRFRWSPVQGATHYHLQVGRSLLFIPATVDETLVTPFCDVPRKQMEARMYYWRVASVDELGTQGAYSVANLLNLTPQKRGVPPAPKKKRRSRIRFQPESPTPDTLYAARTNAQTTVAFGWHGKVWRARVQVATDPGFAKPLVDRTVLPDRALVKLSPGTYFYRLSQYTNRRRSTDALWSDPVEFTVLADDDPPEIRVATPASEVFTVDTTVIIQGATDADVELLLGGRRVPINHRGEFIHEARLEEGRNELVLTAKDAAGNQTTHTVVAVRLPAALKVSMRERLQRLQVSLDELAAMRDHLDLQARELTLSVLQSDNVTPEVAQGVIEAEKELKRVQTLREELAAELDSATRSFELLLEPAQDQAAGAQKDTRRLKSQGKPRFGKRKRRRHPR